VTGSVQVIAVLTAGLLTMSCEGSDSDRDAFPSPADQQNAEDMRSQERTPSPPSPNGCLVYGTGPILFLPTSVGTSTERDVTITGCASTSSLLLDLSLAGGDGAFAAAVVEPPWVPGEDPLKVGILQQITLRQTFSPPEKSPLEDGHFIPFETTLRLTFCEDSLPGRSAPPSVLEVEAQGIGIAADCISAAAGVEPLPQDAMSVRLLGSDSLSPAGPIIGYNWTVEALPEATLLFHPSSAAADVLFTSDIAGDYVAWLTVQDEAATPQCEAEPLHFTLTGSGGTALPTAHEEGLFAILIWRTPAAWDDAFQEPQYGTNLDLHLVHEWAGGPDLDGDGVPDGWFDDPYDCWAENPQPQWGDSSLHATDDPLQTGDGLRGGPETIYVKSPEPLEYRVGVHSAESYGYGPSFARALIYIDGDLVLETDEVLLKELDMWEVCLFDGETGEVQPVVDDDGSPGILPLYANPYGQ